MTPGPVLGIDTTTPLGGVAVVGEEGVLAAYAADVHGSHSPRLMAAVEKLLADAGLRPGDLAGIGVSIGPGSFTGLRVGVATAMGLARAADLPLYPVPTLEVVAQGAPRADGEVVAVAMIARRDEVYGACFEPRGDGWNPLLAPRALSPGAFLADLCALEVPCLLAGTGSAMVIGDGPAPKSVRVADPVFARPRVELVAWRARAMHAAGEPVVAADLAPRYLKASQAEIAWQARQSGA